MEGEVFGLRLEPAASLLRGEVLHTERPAPSTWGNRMYNKNIWQNIETQNEKTNTATQMGTTESITVFLSLTCRNRFSVSGDVTGRHLDGVSQPGSQSQMLSLEKWELRGLTHEQPETRERREDRLIGQPLQLELLNSCSPV